MEQLVNNRCVDDWAQRRRWCGAGRLAIISLVLGWGGVLPVWAADGRGGAVENLHAAGGRAALVKRWREESQARRLEAWQQARAAGWSPKGPGYELQAIRNQRVYIYHTMNDKAALSTAAAAIRNTAPYAVNGSGRTVGVWDEGSVRSTHREFGGRVTVKDGAPAYGHATHVGGTIGAAGVTATAQGMAPSVAIDSYDWNDDAAEMAARAMMTPGEDNKIQLSNHSYGYNLGWSGTDWYGVWPAREDEGFGQYEANAQAWDALCYQAPYYLPCKAAGNDRDDSAPAAGATFSYYIGSDKYSKTYDPAADPYSDGFDQGGFDTILGDSTGKNILTVGAVSAAVDDGSRAPGAAGMAAFSGWGPTDDGRIKPDVVGDGVDVYSTYSSYSSSDDSYAWMSGTSMATPNVCGSAVLLTEFYGRLFPGQYLRASALKGLLIHTADDLGNPGPDYAHGWGLVNVKGAAELLQQHHDEPSALHLMELVLDAATTNVSVAFHWDGTHAIRATLCWTDPAGPLQHGLDDPTRVLVNDLDLRIIGPTGQVYFPYVLQPANPTAVATTGTNVVDNVEQVYIAAPGSNGFYTLVVSARGSNQVCSVVLSGSTSSTSAPPSIMSGSLWPSGQTGVAYQQSLAAVGGMPPYAWSLVAGALPAGLSLSSGGVVNGTPILAGTAQGRLRVMDQQGAIAESAFRLPIAARFLAEGFEHGGAMPDGWTQQVIAGATNWTVQAGGYEDYGQAYPSAAHAGGYNAYLYVGNDSNHTTRLITPRFDCGGLTQSVQVIFWHCMEFWEPDQDELRVYYTRSAGSTWDLLATYTDRVATWTQRTLTLPNPGSSNYLAFEGTAKWGYGVCLDDVTITADAPAPTNTSYGTPYAWLAQAGLAGGGDYELADASDADGDGYAAWQEYVAGTVPTNAASRLQAGIVVSNGGARITWAPDLGAARVYTVEGGTNLADNAWGATNAGSRYFRVKVGMP